VITARPWRHHGEPVDLPAAVLAAGASAGLIPAARCVALLAGLRGGKLIPRPSFFQLDNIRKARRRGEPWHLIVHEDVLIFRAPPVLKSAGSGTAGHVHRGRDRTAGAVLARPGRLAA
jgi:modification methylase